MSLFAGISPNQQEAPQQGGGLFANLHAKLTDPAVKAGLLQAGMALLNPNPGQSPFSQIASGVGQGIMAHQKYQDLVTQENKDKADALAAAEADRQKQMTTEALNRARIAQIENNIRTSQENASSLGALRSAQAKKAAAGGSSGGSKAFSSAWRAFYRNKTALSGVGTVPTPEQINSWKQEFNALEAAGPGGGAAVGSSGVSAPSSGPDPATVQAWADEQGISFEEAAQQLQDLQDNAD